MSNTNDSECEWILGYMFNEPWLLQTALDHQWCIPAPGESIESARHRGILDVLDLVLRRSQISGITIDNIWIGENSTVSCWALPMSYKKETRTKEMDAELKQFCELLQVPDSAGRRGALFTDEEPYTWASVDGCVPSILRGTDKYEKHSRQYVLVSRRTATGFVLYVSLLIISDIHTSNMI